MKRNIRLQLPSQVEHPPVVFMHIAIKDNCYAVVLAMHEHVKEIVGSVEQGDQLITALTAATAGLNALTRTDVTGVIFTPSRDMQYTLCNMRDGKIEFFEWQREAWKRFAVASAKHVFSIVYAKRVDIPENARARELVGAA